MRSRSGRGRVGQPLEPPRGRAQVALDVGEPARRRSRRRSPGWTSRASCRATSSRAGRERGRARERLEPALDVARGVEDPHDLRATTSSVRSTRPPATWSRSRAKPASSQAGPPASAISASSAATVASSSTARGLPCGAPRQRERVLASPGAPWSVADRRRHVEREQLARAGVHRRALGGGRLEHADADRRALVDERRVAADRPARSRAARPPSAASPTVQRVSPWRSSGDAAALSSLAQPRADLLAQRVEVVALGDERAAVVLDAEASSAGAAGAGRGSQAPRGIAHAAERLQLARERVEQRLAARRRRASSSGRRDLRHRHERRAGSSFGSERISAVTSSARSAGTSQSKPTGLSCGSTLERDVDGDAVARRRPGRTRSSAAASGRPGATASRPRARVERGGGLAGDDVRRA